MQKTPSEPLMTAEIVKNNDKWLVRFANDLIPAYWPLFDCCVYVLFIASFGLRNTIKLKGMFDRIRKRFSAVWSGIWSAQSRRVINIELQKGTM